MGRAQAVGATQPTVAISTRSFYEDATMKSIQDALVRQAKVDIPRLNYRRWSAIL